MKKLIINADDFGISKETNLAIKQGFESGIITATSLIVNLEAFEHAIFDILPSCNGLDVGFHFNIIEGKSLTNQPLLCDENGFFNNSYGQLIIKSLNKEFLKQVEIEFRVQIEKALSHCKISHIDSHVHTHAIPSIFKLVSKLTEEYNIPFIRTQKELPYIIWKKSFNLKFILNIVKNILLNMFTATNKAKGTNDYFIGVLYTGFMDEEAILKGLSRIKKENTITEVIFHPTIDENKQNNYKEFLITQNPNFKEELKNSGFALSNYINS